MAQPNCIVEQLVRQEGQDGEVTIRGSALREFAQRVAGENWEREEEVKLLREEVERLRHLVAIREEMMESVEAERKRLERELREVREGREKGSEGKRGKKLDDLSAIELDSFAEESFVAAEPTENRQLTDTRKKICLKKAKRPTPTRPTPITPNQDLTLNLAKTQLQVTKLRSELSQMQFNNQLLLIENQHLSEECRLTERRERMQQNSISELLKQSNKENVCGNGKSSGKKYRLGSCLEERDQGLIRGELDHAKMVPPPITPHFSNFTSMFSKKAQMIDLQPCLSEQQETQGSEGYRG